MSQAKGKSQASKGKHLKNSLEYILNPEKTEKGTLIGGSHILSDTDFAFEKMLETKRIMDERFGYKKTEGRQGYHFVLSFSPKDDVAPEMAMEITERFIKNYIPDYESVYAVHTDRKHLHSHIVFNSVNLINGQKYRYENGDWAKIIQPITNRLCKEYGLSTIELEDYDKRKSKKKSITQLIQEDVEECLKKVKSKTQFDHEMEKRGYTIKRKGKNGQNLKNVTVIPPKTGKKDPKGHRLKGEQKKTFDSLPEHFKDIKAEKKKTEEKVQDKTKKILSEQATRLLLSQIDNRKKNKEDKGVADWEEDRMDKDGIEEETEEEDYQEENHRNQQYEDHRKNTDRNTYSNSNDGEKADFTDQKKEKVFYHVKFKQTKVKVDMAGRYLIRDLRYRKNGRYYQEYVKFDLTRKKIKYLHNHSIKTMEDLRNRKVALQKAAEKLESKKIMLWKERYPYKKLFDCYKRLEALRIPVQLYRDGDITFQGEYEEMRKLIDKIHKSGMKPEELKALYERMHGQLSEIGQLEHELKKEMALCDAIEKDSKKKQAQQLEQNQQKQNKRKTKKVR
ncbi:MAG: relaxase/mobilization nuclease domain-containing protein [Lachnospiraceae bacterium]|nr:relaxase/mobilization nuclease domain-containing protein [Lachnospiraceae bacterium]